MRRAYALAMIVSVVSVVSGVAWGQADDVDCKQCVDKRDIAKQSISASRMRDGAVTERTIREGAVTESKLSQDAVRAVSASATAHVSSSVDMPQSRRDVMLALDPDFADGSSGLIEVPFDARLMATVSMRLVPKGDPTFAQCRLFARPESNVAISAMSNFIPRIPIPEGGVATSLSGALSVGPGVYDVSLRCGAGSSGGAPIASLEEALLIVWAAAQ